ncbi:hypothetical protein GCM10007939_06520 [Amylibacter marinus]|uniref:DUF3445 domain-containing protein n=1 Tax=Amylibacter marinus TaxID=1475483 RepID=A0ABQ5VT86_9RHOB|nr:DUF3445 domain-containing protein [Amylibacter marinus]GLQ34369.1 hypothetical protein GCM10007939_06520 [Amylibacter marinus]
MTDFPPILQSQLPPELRDGQNRSRLPGLLALEPSKWILRDEAFAAQMRYADHLLSHRTAEVFQTLASSNEACTELRDLVVASVLRTEGYQKLPSGWVQRPDGVAVEICGCHPLIAARRLVQQDLCILQKPHDEHVLVGAALCFPASWCLADKIGRPMRRIHLPVTEYSNDLARRVQRILDNIQVDRPVWRMNRLLYRAPDLFHPCREDAPRDLDHCGDFIRSERQVLMKLPVTGAVVFGIHTFVVRGMA